MTSSKPLRIFHILSNPNFGGIEGMLAKVIPLVNTDKYDMRIVNMRNESRAYELWDKAGLRYHKLPTPSKLLLDGVYGLAKLLRHEKVDVVEIHGLRANIIGRLAATFAGVPIILTSTLSTDDWRKWYHVWLDRLTSWTVNGWIPNSNACKQSLIEREKFCDKKIHVIYDGIDISYWTRTPKKTSFESLRSQWDYSEKDIIFATIANLRPDKGIHFLIEAISSILKKHENARFVVAGDDCMGGQLQNKARELGVDHAIKFLGFRKDIKEIYESVDAVILPSLREGLPICLIEAMSMELPVIATAVSGTPELVDDGITGILVPPKDPEAISKAVNKICSDLEIYKQKGVAGRKRVCDLFTIERMIEQLLEYYQYQFNSHTDTFFEEL